MNNEVEGFQGWFGKAAQGGLESQLRFNGTVETAFRLRGHSTYEPQLSRAPTHKADLLANGVHAPVGAHGPQRRQHEFGALARAKVVVCSQ